MQQACKPSKFSAHHSVRRPAVRSVRAHSERASANKDRSTAALGAVDLPHGVLWWNDRSHSVYQHDVVHGQDFVLQRSRPGGPGLVLARQISSMQIVDQEERKRVSIQAYLAQTSKSKSQLALSDGFTFDVTDYALEDESCSRQLAAHNYPPTSCTGIVLMDRCQQHNDQVFEQVHTSHSRRTKAVKFTCKLCGTSSLKAVNPHAWATGTVFARCDGCQVIHKLTDNIELFHELAGPVIEPRPNLDHIKIPASLPQKPYMP